MIKLLSALALLVTAASAAADPIALDYRATDASCVTATRFADEVSAKLGFVPWRNDAAARIQVRVGRDGAQFVGSVRNTDGSSKIVDGHSCAEVTATLAVSVAGAIDPSSTPQRGAPGATTATSLPMVDDLPVTFASADGRRVDVSINTGGGVSHGHGHGNTVVANFYEGLCTTPCTARLPRGRHFLSFRDPDTRVASAGGFLIDEPTTLTLHRKSRSGVRRGMLIAGLSSIAIGTACLFAENDMTKILGAGLGYSLGFSFSVAPLFFHDTFTVTRTPR